MIEMRKNIEDSLKEKHTGADTALISMTPIAPVVHSYCGPKIQRTALFGGFLGDLGKRN
jgi:hypothetical protein